MGNVSTEHAWWTLTPPGRASKPAKWKARKQRLFWVQIQRRDPFNAGWGSAEVRKFLGVEWVATGPDGLVPFHSQKEFPAHLKWNEMEDVGSLLPVIELDDDFDGDINSIVCSSLTSVTSYLNRPFPDVCQYLSLNATFDWRKEPFRK